MVQQVVMEDRVSIPTDTIIGEGGKYKSKAQREMSPAFQYWINQFKSTVMNNRKS